MSVFLLIILFFGLGLTLQRHVVVPHHLPATLNLLVINLAYPAAVLLSVSSASWNLSAIFPVLAYWTGVPLLGLLTWSLKAHFGWSKQTYACVFLLTACGNTAFLGFPMVKAFFPEEATRFALLYDQLGSFLAVSIIGPIVISLVSQQQQQFFAGAVVKKIVSFPPFVILVLSMAVPLEPIVAPLRPVLALCAWCIVPLTMLAIGLQFKINIAKQHQTPVAIALLIKMLILPLAVFGFGLALATPSLVLYTTVFEAAMPPMVTAAALLLAAKVNDDLVIAILGIGTLLAFISLPVLSQLLPV